MATSSTDRASLRAVVTTAFVLLTCALAGPSAASAAPPLQLGSEGPRVEALQRAFGMKIDGVFGERLRRAVMGLQRANGLRADGTVGPATWGLLERIRARARARHRQIAPRGADGALPPAATPQRPASGAAVRRVVRSRRPSRGSRGRTLTSRGAQSASAGVRPRKRRASAGVRPRKRRGSAGVRPRTRRGSARPAAGAQPVRSAAEARALLAVQSINRRLALADRRTPVVAAREPSLRAGIRTLVASRDDGPPRPPLVVRRVIAAGDRIATMPYRYGGGHGNFDDSGYDCSGSVSYALHGGGLLDLALASGGFMSWGEPGPGRWITIYASPGHMFMVVAGRRFDTSGRSQTGSRWQADTRGAGAGYAVRHPAGL